MSAQPPTPPTFDERLSEWWKRQRAITKIAIIVSVTFPVTFGMVIAFKADRPGNAPEPAPPSGIRLAYEADRLGTAPEPIQAISSPSLYIWIPNYADTATANQLIDSYPATVRSVCAGIMGGTWTPANEPDYWNYFDICAVNAQLGFADPSGVATIGCASANSGCKKYSLRQ